MNSTRTRLFLLILLPLLLLLAGVYAASAGSPTPPVADDPLVRMPGTQPGEVLIEAPPYCLVCHSEYDQDVEPGFNWMGSMMAQSARDFVFFAAMAVAGQDSVWAIDSPNAMDICERCHFPKGWLEGRSDPPNASAMLAADYDGVQCDVCHRMIDPFFELTYQGTRESSDWIDYWDEAGNTGPGSGTLAQTAADATHTQDALLLQAIEFFNGNPFYGPDNLPVSPGYTENGSGQYYVSPNTDKRGPFADANSPHQILYSRYHKSKFFCSSCHDVSNPVLANIDFAGTPPGDGSTVLPTEEDSAYAYFHVERTFSEFMLSDYGQPGGAEGIGPFASDEFTTSHTTDVIATCQDCHLRDVAGQAAFQGSAVYRTGDPATTESTEHPYSGQPLHDMTGGNAWVGTVLASAAVGSPNYDPVNDALLNQGP
ncbi:MAG: hypothetical protein ACK2U9_08230, partial [Anaerolineae bacterium]